jgi:hypothetical protein
MLSEGRTTLMLAVMSLEWSGIVLRICRGW